MSNIRPTGSPPAMFPLPEPGITDTEAANLLLSLSQSAPRAAEPARASPTGTSPGPGSPGTADVNRTLAGERSARTRVLQGAGVPDASPEHEVHRPSSPGGPHGSVSAGLSTSGPGEGSRRRGMMSVAEMAGSPAPQTPADVARPSSPRETSMAASLRQSYRATRSPSQADETTVQAAPVDKGKGRAIESSPPPEQKVSSYELGDKRSRPQSNTPEPSAKRLHVDSSLTTLPETAAHEAAADKGKGKGKGKAIESSPPPEQRASSYELGDKRSRSQSNTPAPPAKRLNVDSSLTALAETASHEATAASQPHPYMNITPRPNVAQMLEQGKSLVKIWGALSAPLDARDKRSLNNFVRHIEAEGKTAAQVFSNFHAFIASTSDYLDNNEVNVPEKALVRKLRSLIFELPSQAKVNELIQTSGTELAGTKENVKKIYQDLAGRLDEMLATMMFDGSPYEGTDAARRFIGLKHQISLQIKNGEISVHGTFSRFLTLLRQDAHPLPQQDDAFRPIVAGCLQHGKPAVKRRESAIKTAAAMLAEIAFMNDISQPELIHAILEWRMARNAILSPDLRKTKGVGAVTDLDASNFKAAQTPRQIEVFQMIDETLNGEGAHNIDDVAINDIADFLLTSAGQPYRGASTSGNAS